MLPNDRGISKELIFFLKDRLGLSDTSIFLDEYNLSNKEENLIKEFICLLYTSPSPRDRTRSRMPSSA